MIVRLPPALPADDERASLYRRCRTRSIDELDGYAFELGIPVDEIAGDTASMKARELIRYVKARGRSGELKALLDRDGIQ